MHISNWARTPMQTKQFSIAFPSSSVLSVLAVTREIDHESMRQFYLNFRHIFRCNLRESWTANTVRPKPICICNSILVFWPYDIFFLNEMRQFYINFIRNFRCIVRESTLENMKCTVNPKSILIRNFNSGKVKFIYSKKAW